VLFSFVVPPASGAAFDTGTAKLALDRASTARCGAAVARAWLALLPDGHVEPHIRGSAANLPMMQAEGQPSMTEIQLRNDATARCIEGAHRRVKLPPFAGSPVEAVISLEVPR
jgi:hypothetical protein